MSTKAKKSSVDVGSAFESAASQFRGLTTGITQVLEHGLETQPARIPPAEQGKADMQLPAITCQGIQFRRNVQTIQ